MATAAVANLCIRAPLPRGQKKESRRTSTEGVNDSRTAREFPPTKVIHSLQTQRGDVDSMRYRRKKTASLSQAAMSTAGRWTLGKTKLPRVGWRKCSRWEAEGLCGVGRGRIVSGAEVEPGESVTIVVH
jgi:hypothetical protein